MKYFVCVKQVPDVSQFQVDPTTGSIIREGVPSIMNPLDKNAIETALQLKDAIGKGEITAITMGPPQSKEVLREALAMGVDNAVCLTDKKFAGADTLATSYTLAMGIKYLLDDEKVYLVICGGQALDGETAQVGPQLAEELAIPQITRVLKCGIAGKKIIAEKDLNEDEIMVLESPLPSLISVLKEINTPRLPTMNSIALAYEKEIHSLDANTLGADDKKIGIQGSQTRVLKVFEYKPKGDRVILEGSVDDVVSRLFNHLKEDKVIP